MLQMRAKKEINDCSVLSPVPLRTDQYLSRRYVARFLFVVVAFLARRAQTRL
jgi:hypothetical protein